MTSGSGSHGSLLREMSYLVRQSVEAQRQRHDFSVLDGGVKRALEPGFVPVTGAYGAAERVVAQYAIRRQGTDQPPDLSTEDCFVVSRAATGQPLRSASRGVVR